MNKWWIWIHQRLCGFNSDGNRSNFPPVIPNISTHLTTQSLLILCAFDYFDGNDEVNIGLSLSIFEWILPSFLLRTFPLTKRGGPRRNKARLRKRTRIGTVSLIQFHVLFSPEFKLCEWICSRNKNCSRRSERNIRFNEGRGGQIIGKRVTSLPFFLLHWCSIMWRLMLGGFFCYLIALFKTECKISVLILNFYFTLMKNVFVQSFLFYCSKTSCSIQKRYCKLKFTYKISIIFVIFGKQNDFVLSK